MEQMRLMLAESALPAPPTARQVRNSAYDAAAFTRRTLRWHAPTTSPNQTLLYSLATLRDRSRAAARNDGYAGGALDRLVTNIIGHGIKPLSQAKDAAFRQAIQDLWLRWTDESDADGLLDWYGQEAQATRCWLEAGEAFVRLRPRRLEDGLSVPLQVQVIEPELCPHTWDRMLPSGNRVRAGIEFDAIGRRVAYWFHPQRPGDLYDFDPSTLVRVPAHAVVHLYDPRRPGQLRGIPHLTASLVRLFELDKFEDAILLRTQLQNMFMGFLRRAPGLGTDSVHPLTGDAPATDASGQPLIEMQPGTFNELNPGEEVEFSDPPDIGTSYVEFMRQQLLGACAAHGVPYEVLTGDMSKVNDRTVRVVLQEFRRRVQMWQHQIVAFQLCRRVWRAWMDRVFLAGVVPMPMAYLEDPAPWLSVAWSPHAWPYQHPVQDVQAAKEAVRSGFRSRSQVVSEQGEDAAVIDQEQRDDNARADELGLRYDSDGRVATGSANTPNRDAETDPSLEAGQPAGASV